MSTTTSLVDELAGVRRPRALAGAGVVYVAAWLIGLAAAPSAPSQDAADATIHAFYADNGSAALLQATLVHGIAGVALAVFIVALVRRLALVSSKHRTLVLVAGLAAAAVSLIQYAMEIGLNRAADGGEVSTSATLFHAVNIADTVKLVLLAVAIAAATRLAADAHALPRWLRGLGYALAPVLVIGGAAFVITSDALSAVLAASLLLLLLWVGAVGAALTRRSVTRPQAAE
jgi:hypothetical protein